MVVYSNPQFHRTTLFYFPQILLSSLNPQPKSAGVPPTESRNVVKRGNEQFLCPRSVFFFLCPGPEMWMTDGVFFAERISWERRIPTRHSGCGHIADMRVGNHCCIDTELSPIYQCRCNKFLKRSARWRSLWNVFSYPLEKQRQLLLSEHGTNYIVW